MYKPGQHKFMCDVCGFEFYSSEKRKRWDGLIVCPTDYETDHPQKYIRVYSDGQAVSDARPEPSDVFAPHICTPITRTAAADVGTADCLTVGFYTSLNYADYGAYTPRVWEIYVYGSDVYEAGVYE